MKLKNLIIVLLLHLMIFACTNEEDENFSKPEISTSEVSAIMNTTAICGGDLSTDGGKTITSKGIVWHISASATIEVNTGITIETTELGEFVSSLKDLKADTKYFVRAYAINKLGTVYGEEKEFTTTNYYKPEISTSEVTEITNTSAICGGNLKSDGDKTITSKGIVWHTSVNATIEVNTGITTGINELGGFVSSLKDLTEGTKYFVRAYATNDLGTVYGEEKEFTTIIYRQPEITTTEVTEIMNTTAICGGNLISDGNKTITAKGIVWHTSANATVEENTGITTGANLVGVFVSKLTDLKLNTKYFVRAYATNEMGTVYGEEKEFTTNSDTISIEMVTVTLEGGAFQMGGNIYEENANPTHAVTISSFEIGKYEVTQAQWLLVMGNNPSKFKGENLPVEQVSWDDIQIFMDILYEQTGIEYRLPTEAEWEFAARGGISASSTTYAGSNTIEDVAWYAYNSEYKTHEIGTKQANELGVYNMSGNVCEWCSDLYDSSYYSISPTNNPQGPASGYKRVIRGGSWYYNAGSCDVSNRYFNDPRTTRGDIGFRIARSL